MNKIYALKYSYVTGGLIAVSELTRKVTTGTRKKLLIASVISLSLLGGMENADATLYIDNMWARDFLDLGQNKGQFKAGERNVTVQLKDGSTFTLPDLPIPDFSVAAKNAAVTSIGGAYGISASHYAGNHYGVATSTWGQTTYKKIDRISSRTSDFAAHRFDKFVVETTGVKNSVDFSLSSAEALERYGVMYYGKKQLAGFRVGNGMMPVVQNNTSVSTGGAYVPELVNGGLIGINWGSPTNVFTNKTAFTAMPQQGDSGSVALLYDNELKEWVALGTLSTLGFNKNGYVFTLYGRYDNNSVTQLKDYYTQNINTGGQDVKITQDNYTINDEKTEFQITDNETGRKDLKFTGGGNIIFESSLDQGNGGLIFGENEKYNISGENTTFRGAGIDIGKDSTVDWNIKYASNDNLHKIGEGVLDVKQTQNTNLKTGNGTVILSAEKAFNNIYMASGNGTVKLNHTNALAGGDYNGIYFTKNGGTLDLNGYDQTFGKIAATDSGTTITNTNNENSSTLKITATDNYIYHGNIDGNINLDHEDTRKDKSQLIMDGDIDINDINIKNANVTFQGHATDHAVFREGGVTCHWGFLCETDYVKGIQQLEQQINKEKGTQYKTNNQISSFDQPDWDTRTFKFRTLNLDNTAFSVGRNASVEGDIIASNSDITIGDATAYIDTYSGKNITGTGFAFRQSVSQGTSSGESYFSGQIISTGGSVKVGDKATVTLSKPSSLDGTDLTIEKGGVMTAQGGLFTSKEATIGGTLNLTGTPGQNNTWTSSLNFGYGGYNLTEDSAQFTAKNQASITADIKSDKAAMISLGQKENTVNNTNDIFALAALNGFDASLEGKIEADKSSLTMNNALWKVTGNSALNRMSITDSMTMFRGDNNTFSTLTVDEMTTNNSAFVMRANTQQADQLIVKNKLEGANNLLLVDFIEKKGNGLNIDLVKAPENTSKDVFKTETQTIGFSDVTPLISQNQKEGQSVWTLTGYKTVANASAAAKATSLMSGNYKAFLNEVNNLNKRMGDLRDINGEAGAWARIMSGAGSAGGGYSDNYTHVQIGADKKHELDGLDLFTGLTMTYTDSHAGSHDFSGETKSVGAGLYASAMFDSGAYIDLIGKYVHHDNEYTATFAGLGTKDYSSHSWYAG
ncbi:TPA: autotransporter outer membrane beta-barrel domain-containing protein, partial [Escherichia coli]|nr:autotransporter outer membrane beta-barrel domain-containing protein [Escherichia coli]